jgi:hypothetical protein
MNELAAGRCDKKWSELRGTTAALMNEVVLTNGHENGC